MSSVKDLALPPPEERRAIREAAGISRTQLAQAIGCSRESVWRWEDGDRQPRGLYRQRYAEELQALREMNETPDQ